MPKIQVRASGETIEFELEDENGKSAHFRMDRLLTTELVFRALVELKKLPPEEGGFLKKSTQFFQGRPSFQTAIGDSGDCVVAFRLDPFPTMQFLFDDKIASKLARELTEITSTPRNMRLQKMKH